MGQLHNELGHGRDAARYLVEAHRIMDYLFGKEHFLSKQTKGFMDHALASLMHFQRNFVNILEKAPEAKKALEERLMTSDEKKALKENEKNKNKRKNKNKKNGQKHILEQKKDVAMDDDLGDLPELVSEM